MTEASFFFIRHGQLVAPYLDHLKMDYETLTKLSLGTLDPGINDNASELFAKQTAGIDFSSVHTIYYNNSGKSSTRSLESANCIIAYLKERYGRDVHLLGLPEIREVNFDVSGLITKQEFVLKGMAAIRSTLYEASLRDGASEPITEIANRIRTLHNVINNHAEKNESTLFVTHDFFMRFLEVYITRKDRLENITVAELENTSLNSYFCGFSTDSSLRALDRWGA